MDEMDALLLDRAANPRFETALKTLFPFCEKRGFLGSQLTTADLPAELKDLFDKSSEVIPEVATVTVDGYVYLFISRGSSCQRVISVQRTTLWKFPPG